MKPPDPELEAALAAIAEGPGDDSRRRVLGDLLQERGDPRGEFMLLQFLIAENQASGAMRQRAENLWRSNRRKWLEGVDKVLADVKLERGFPVEASLAPTITLDLLTAALSSPMMTTLERLSARRANQPALIVDALASPRLRVLRDVALPDRRTFEAAAERGVPGRLTRLELHFELTDADCALLLESPVFSRLERLSFVPFGTQRRGARKAGSAEPLGAQLQRLSAHPSLMRVSLLGPFGLTPFLAAVAKAWPALKFTVVLASGSFEFSREPDGTHVMLQNMSRDELLAVRPTMPPGTVHVALMPQPERWGAESKASREQLLAAYAGLDPRILP